MSCTNLSLMHTKPSLYGAFTVDRCEMGTEQSPSHSIPACIRLHLLLHEGPGLADDLLSLWPVHFAASC